MLPISRKSLDSFPTRLVLKLQPLWQMTLRTLMIWTARPSNHSPRLPSWLRWNPCLKKIAKLWMTNISLLLVQRKHNIWKESEHGFYEDRLKTPRRLLEHNITRCNSNSSKTISTLDRCLSSIGKSSHRLWARAPFASGRWDSRLTTIIHLTHRLKSPIAVSHLSTRESTPLSKIQTTCCSSTRLWWWWIQQLRESNLR